MTKSGKKEFRVNEYITLKLDDAKTFVYVNDKYVAQCRFIIPEISVQEIVPIGSMESVDGAEWKIESKQEQKRYKVTPPPKFKVTPEEEFWVQCSNIQVWAEDNYETRLLHRNIAFPLLKKLAEAGEPRAKQKMSEEIIKRLKSGSENVVKFLLDKEYLNLIEKDEFLKILYRNGAINPSISQILEAEVKNKGHLWEKNYYAIFKILQDEELRIFCFDDNDHYRPWLQMLTNNMRDRRALNIIKSLLRRGIEELKTDINEKVLTQKIDLYALKDYGYFPHHSKSEMIELCYMEEEEKKFRSWLQKLIDNKRKAYDYGYPILFEFFKAGITELKECFINELENGNYNFLTYMMQSKEHTIFSQEELKNLCFDKNHDLKPWLVNFLDGEYHSVNYGFDLLKKLLEVNDTEAKKEILKRLESGHVYTDKLIRYYNNYLRYFEKKELESLFFEENNNQQYKKWFQEVIENKILKNKDLVELQGKLAELGFKKPKDDVFNYIKEYPASLRHLLFNKKIFSKAEWDELVPPKNVLDIPDKINTDDLKINEFITVKLEAKKTQVYIKGEKIEEKLLYYIHLNASRYKAPEKRYWRVYMRLKEWVEKNYDPSLFSHVFSFPVLILLHEAGHPQAESILKNEIEKNCAQNKDTVVHFILKNQFFNLYTDEKIKKILKSDFIRINTELEGIRRIENNELDLQSAWFTNFNQIERLEEAKSLKKLSLGVLEEIYQEFDGYDDIPEETILRSLDGIEIIPNLEELQINRAKLRKIADQPPLPKLKNLQILASEVAILEGIEKFENLIELDLRFNNISKLDPLKSLTNLKKLLLGENAVRILSPLKNLTQLEELDLHETSVDKFEHLENLTNLRILDCTKCSITKIEELHNLKSLELLNLNSNKITKLEGLENLKNLKTLRLSENKITEISGLENLTHLDVLDLRKNQISELKGLEKLVNLRVLLLAGNPISDIKGLENLKNLEILELNATDLPPGVIEYFSEVADMSKTAKGWITELKGLDSLVKLRQIFLDSQKINEIKGLDNLRNLESINLTRNNIKEIKGLDSLVNLEDLYLTANKLTEIKGLEHNLKLKELSLDRNDITELKGLQNLTKLKKLELKGNPIHKKIEVLIGKSVYNAQDLVEHCKKKSK